MSIPMDTSYRLREADTNDREQLASMLYTNYFETEPVVRNDDLEFRENLVRERLDMMLPNDPLQGKTFVVEKEGVLAALAFVTPDLKKGGWIVDDLFTYAAHRGKNLATKLLAACEDFVKIQNEISIHLSVAENNPALVSFYEKRGWLKQSFTIAGQQTTIDPDTHVPTHHMVKQLNPP
ncbi:MAG TPA: GNAT family N-acetyltransferase [Alphaproteobacteria bacterium]|nr:GNAT family N-acetyltransferase [Alphaproteobacteria bacterium]